MKILVITGASGAGKTAVIREIEARNIPGVRCFHFDSIGVPSLAEMERGYGSGEEWQRSVTRDWVARLANLPPDVWVAVLEGQTRPNFVFEAAWNEKVRDVAVMLFDCTSQVRNSRLRALRNQPELADATMESWAEYLRRDAKERSLKVIDTTSASIQKIADELERYIANGMMKEPTEDDMAETRRQIAELDAEFTRVGVDTADVAAFFRAQSPEAFADAERDESTPLGIDAPSALDAIRTVKTGAGTDAFLAAMAFHSPSRRPNEVRIRWQRLDIPGDEVCTLESNAYNGRLSGVAFFSHDGKPCRLSYTIECDEQWKTRSASIRGEIGSGAVSLDIARSPANEWRANGLAIPAVDGCIDIDLGFSPSTNLLPIRRLSLEVGRRAVVRAAWVRFPELSVEMLDQSYARLDENRYLYESAGGEFRRELLVSPEGFVLDYPDYWRVEATTGTAP